MANSDYKKSGIGTFATYVKNDVALDFETTTISYTEFNFDTRTEPVKAGDAAMVGDEIMRVESFGVGTLTVKRGCADTIPAQHAADSLIWIINETTGTDMVEHSAGETVSAKISPITIGGGEMPITAASPDAVTFDWRFFRPYAPGQMRSNTARWHAGTTISDATGSMNLTWVHRDRVLQADQLVGHDDASIGPEPGTTYTLRIYNASNVMLREEYGIVGTSFMYLQAKALHDFDNPSSSVNAYATFSSHRQMTDSRAAYRIPFTVEPSASPIPSNWLAFDQRAIESPYIWNARKGQAVNSAFGVAMAARPSDRMSDYFKMIHRYTTEEDTGEVDENDDPIYETVIHHDEVGDAIYLPWLTTKFRLPELETTMTILGSSLYDGVNVSSSIVGKLGLIDDELVQITALNVDGTVVLARGVGDTIPAVHIANSRLWLFEPDAAQDLTNRSGSIDYRLAPGVYGPPVNPETLPAQVVAFNSRALRPYNVGQLVVDGRPWFEEAVAQVGLPVSITWAWRNRITQGATARPHSYPSVDPEAGTQAVLTFFYEQPPGVEHVLRTVTIDPAYEPGPIILDGQFDYPYSFAVTDGGIAGSAQGVCGTTVIYCRVNCTRPGYTSLQSYRIPIRVPSYPC